jgi:hypothetical protein
MKSIGFNLCCANKKAFLERNFGFKQNSRNYSKTLKVSTMEGMEGPGSKT